MNIANDLVQCWECQTFDRLFRIISAAAAVIYDQMVSWAWIVLVGFWVFYILWIVWRNMRDNESSDWLYMDSVKPALIYSLIACVLLGIGVAFPRFITMITFEPVAAATNTYAEIVLQSNPEMVDQRVSYQPEKMDGDGFFRPELRDKIISLMKTTTTQFQSMINLGLAVMKNAFSLKALVLGGFDGLLKHILMFMMGAYLVYKFFRLFMRFCFYFVDVIVNLALFAFFFPFMIILFIFKHSKSTADWVQKMGDAFSGSNSLIKNVFNSICALAVAVITYAIVMVIIAKFFAMDSQSSNALIQLVLKGTVTEKDLANENLTNLTLMGCITIGFVVNYLVDKIPKISEDIWAAFGVRPDHSMGDEIGEKVEQVVKNAIGGVAKKAGVLTAGSKGGEGKKE